MATADEKNENNKDDDLMFHPLSLDDFLRRQEENADNYEAAANENYHSYVDTQGDYSCTGVWQSARGLLDYLLSTTVDHQHSHTLPATTSTRGRGGTEGDTCCTGTAGVDESASPPLLGNLLELGAGTGWLGLQLAHQLGPQKCLRILLTDRQGAWLQENLREARRQGLRCENVQTQSMDWSQSKHVEQVAACGPWDCILGSDLVYSEGGISHLAQALAILAGCHPQGSLRSRESHDAPSNGTPPPPRPPRILYAHTQGRMPELDCLWQEELQKQGMTWKVVAELPVKLGQGNIWHGRTTLVMDIFPRNKSTEEIK